MMSYLASIFFAVISFFFGPHSVPAPSASLPITPEVTVISTSEFSTSIATKTPEASFTTTDESPKAAETPTKVTTQPKTFTEPFSQTYTVQEVGSISESTHPDWWVSSGGYFYSRDGLGSTIVGVLPTSDERRTTYARTNPRDTDNGYYPQNIFRLVQRGWWGDYTQEIYYKIVTENLSESEYRNGSNGLLLFNRYQDADNLYYTGIRVDGQVVVKKKQYGKYTDLGAKKVFAGTYNRETNPNLLPIDTLLGLKTDVKTNADASVSISVFIDSGKTGVWTKVLSVTDDGSIGGPPMLVAGHAGIRTDFMDVEFYDYSITSD